MGRVNRTVTVTVPPNHAPQPTRFALLSARLSADVMRSAKLLSHPWETGWLSSFGMSLIILETVHSTLRQQCIGSTYSLHKRHYLLKRPLCSPRNTHQDLQQEEKKKIAAGICRKRP